jgi:hypothetical protein
VLLHSAAIRNPNDPKAQKEHHLIEIAAIRKRPGHEELTLDQEREVLEEMRSRPMSDSEFQTGIDGAIKRVDKKSAR